ncbi:hypothetical protein DXG03_002554 [Asterophora parasitica]|uniref:Uncharacterized protein n=1 Tax=Asterophora parasitica TaxID=117018 RepID=A0A9P7G8Q6_9AGAR|nr:hypothetical protein DXG03_002554 [Asterophora parasitica]
MSSQYTPASPLQPYHIRNLILILRRANDHYAHVAARIRASLRPTRHAHKRAQRLGLTINVQDAVNCPQKMVSVIPLPIIEVSPAPAAPAPLPYTEVGHSIRRQARAEPLQRRPALKCAIPVPAIMTRTSPNGTTSALSSGSHYSSVTLTSAAPAQQQPSAIRYSSRWFATVDEGYPRNATEACAAEVRAAPVMQRAQPTPQEWDILDVPIDEDAMDWGLELQYPEDVSEMEDFSPSDSASTSGSGSSLSSGTSASNSNGPVTPVSPLMIRIKRKSIEVRDDDSFEKRPRVLYDSEAQPQRRNVIRIPARK